MSKKNFIITLNKVDILTLTGFLVALGAILGLLNGYLALGLSLLFFASLFDALDGKLARKIGVNRSFGRYLDGFVDVFDYLAGPALFLYLWGMHDWYYLVILALFLICGIIRLSVFNELGNIEDGKANLAYLGMPVYWSILLLGPLYLASRWVETSVLFPVAAGLFLAMSLWMVLAVPFFKFKKLSTILSITLGGTLLFGLEHFKLSQEASAFLTNPHFFTGIVYFVLPLIISAFAHMLVVTRNWFSCLKKPVYEPWFGANKTWRGFVLLPLFTIPGAWITYVILGGLDFQFNLSSLTLDPGAIHFAVLGSVLGFIYALFELPNSFIKRKMGIPPGGTAPKYRRFFILMDQLDSGIGVGLAAYFFFDAPFYTALSTIALFPLVALVVKRILFTLKLKKDYR